MGVAKLFLLCLGVGVAVSLGLLAAAFSLHEDLASQPFSNWAVVMAFVWVFGFGVLYWVLFRRGRNVGDSGWS